MPWNYRIMRHTTNGSANDEPFYAIHEAYYHKDGAIKGWTEEPAYCSGETVSELIRDNAWYLTALVKPVLDHATGQEVEPAHMLEDDLYAMLRDSGSGPQGENSRSEVEGEAPQSGDSEAGASPSPNSPYPPRT